jgi:hypothetical protein
MREAKLLGFQASERAHHSLRRIRSIGLEIGFGYLSTWVVLTVARSIIWHISWVDGTLLVARPNC